MQLWHSNLRLEDPFKKVKQPVEWSTYEGILYRWRVSNGYFWVLSYDSVGPHSGVHRLPLEKVSITYAEWVRLTNPGLGGLPYMDWSFAPFWALAHRQVRSVGLSQSYATQDGHYSVLPGDKDEIYVLFAWRGEIRVWRGVMRFVDPEAANKPTIVWWDQRWIKWDNAIYPKVKRKPASDMEKEDAAEDARPVLLVRSDLREAFIAYQDKTHFFFVTVSGKLYACRKLGEKQRTELLWDDARNPIRAVIHDTASEKTFAFTKASGGTDKSKRNVWFELAAKVKPIAYDPKKITDWKPADPLPTMMAYSRILLWNVPPTDWRVPTGALTAQQLQQWWTDLTKTDIVKAHRAVWSLAARPADSVAFLKDHLHPVPAATQKNLDQVVADLDCDSFDRREAATRELSRGVVAESVLRKALANSPSLELRRRLEAILEDLPGWPKKNPELLRSIVAIRLLQQIGTPDAQSLLEKLAAGAPSALQTQKAKTALDSLKKR
jgi:hypothetical protein